MSEEFRILTTEQCKQLLDSGATLTVPETSFNENWQGYSDEDKAFASRDEKARQIVSIEEVGSEEVQCIRIDDQKHLYLTDDMIPTHNTNNIIFLKSTDDSMIDTLTKMSGTTHRSYVDSKTVTRDMGRLMMQNEGKASYTMSTKEVPLIAYNDLAFLPRYNSIVFRAGDPVIWNRNDSIMPMAFALYKDTIINPGYEYSIQTVPSLSTALDFDVRGNQPDFSKLLNKRMNQAFVAKECMEAYATAYDYSEYDIQRLDPDTYSDDIMDLINQKLHANEARTEDDDIEIIEIDEDHEFYGMGLFGEDFYSRAEDNRDHMGQVMAEVAQKYNVPSEEKRFAGTQLSPADLVSVGGLVNRSYDEIFLRAYMNVRAHMEKDSDYFSYRNGNLYSLDDGKLLVRSDDVSEDLKTMREAAGDESKRVFIEDDDDLDEVFELGSYSLTDNFYHFLASQKRWRFAEGRFEDEVARLFAD